MLLVAPGPVYIVSQCRCRSYPFDQRLLPEMGSNRDRLLAWPADRYTLCTRPCLNSDRRTGDDLLIARHRSWQEPADQVINEDGETWLQGQVRIVQVKAQRCYPPVLLLPCDQQRSFGSNNDRLHPECMG